MDMDKFVLMATLIPMVLATALVFSLIGLWEAIYIFSKTLMIATSAYTYRNVVMYQNHQNDISEQN